MRAIHRIVPPLVAALLLLGAACGDDDSTGGGDDASSEETVSTTTITEADSGNTATGAPSCNEVFGEGVVLREDAFDISCVKENGDAAYYGAQFLDCEDGRTLYWSEVGWGYVGEPWHTDTTEPPNAETQACA